MSKITVNRKVEIINNGTPAISYSLTKSTGNYNIGSLFLNEAEARELLEKLEKALKLPCRKDCND